MYGKYTKNRLLFVVKLYVRYNRLVTGRELQFGATKQVIQLRDRIDEICFIRITLDIIINKV